MSGASGKVPSAIHIGPEAAAGGPLAKVREGDVIRVDCETGTLDLKVDAAAFASRDPVPFRPNQSHVGLGREMFGAFRAGATHTETGASLFDFLMPQAAE